MQEIVKKLDDVDMRLSGLEEKIEKIYNKHFGPKQPKDYTEIDGLFEEFWQAYPKPRRKEKQRARNIYRKLSPKKHGPIMMSLEAYKKTDQWARDNCKYVPYPARFLNAGRWEDYIEDERPECHFCGERGEGMKKTADNKGKVVRICESCVEKGVHRG